MNKPEILGGTARSLADGVRAGRWTAVEIVEAHLMRVRRHNRRLRAVVSLRSDEALEEARDADRRLASGQPCGPLHGVPMTLKDAFRMAGCRTTWGLPWFCRHVPRLDCEVVRRLRVAGAIIIGRTNVPLASFDWQCRSPLFGESVNPWSSRHTPGGSSGGAAAALAAGLTPLDLGSDVAGSIRYPAHCCGVLGLRTSSGVLPSEDWGPEGLPPLGEGIATCGPMARDLGDLMLALEALGVETKDLPPVPERLRIALSESFGGIVPDRQTRSLLTRLRTRLEGAGHHVIDAEPPVDAADSYRLWGHIVGHSYRPLLPSVLRSGPGRSLFEAYFLRLRLGEGPLTASFREGLRLSRTEYRDRLERWRALRAIAESFFADFDVWLLPVSPSPAIRRRRYGRGFRGPEHGENYSTFLGTYLCPTAMLGTPALTLPIGWATTDLPVGVQLHSRFGSDAWLVALAARHLEPFIELRRMLRR